MVFQILLGERGDRDRCALKIFGALTGGDDDFFQAAIGRRRWLVRLCDRYGRLRPLCFGLTLFVLASAACALAMVASVMLCWLAS